MRLQAPELNLDVKMEQEILGKPCCEYPQEDRVHTLKILMLSPWASSGSQCALHFMNGEFKNVGFSDSVPPVP